MRTGQQVPESTETSSARSDNLNDLLGDYLEDLERPLLGVVADEERSSFIDQTRSHLEQSIADDIEETGDTLTRATSRVLDGYGKAKHNADEFLNSWFEYKMRTPLARRFGHANLVAYGIFQVAVLVYYLILQINVYLPSEATYHIPWRLSPFQIREVWPEPLPFPEFTINFFLTITWPVIAPIVAGAIVGWIIPVRAPAAVYRGLMPLIILSFVMGALLLPLTQGLLFALFQVAYWLPIGCASAFGSSCVARRIRARAFNKSSRPGFLREVEA